MNRHALYLVVTTHLVITIALSLCLQVEMSQSPHLALEATVAAEFGSRPLTEVCPGASHMIHMPSHIDVLVGDYQAAVIANQVRAIGFVPLAR